MSVAVRSPAGRDPRWVRWALVALLVASFALRAWYATAKLDNSRHFDERFSLRNVSRLLVEGDTRPANAFYGSLSYLPQAGVLAASQGLYRVTGIEALTIFDETSSDGWSPTAYLLIRLVTALWGTLGIWAAFVLGRRLFGPRAALLGAVLVGCVPPQIELSARFKPDILVALLVTVAFLWGREAVLRPSPRRWLVAGAGVGLAVAAKYTAVGVAIPLAAGALAGGWGGWRSDGSRSEPRPEPVRRTLGSRLGWLVLAGLASVVVFFLLNPHVAVVFQYLPRLWRIMESKGTATGGSHWTVVALEASYLLRHHGPVILGFAVAGMAGLGARLAGWPRRWAAGGTGGGETPGSLLAAESADGSVARLGPGRLDALMVLSYVVGYSALYAAATKLFRGQNYLPVTVFTSLAAGWAMVGLWDRLAARWPALHRRWLAVPVWAAVAIALLAPRVAQVYNGVVPSTWDRAELTLAAQLRPAAMRRAWYERAGGRPIRPFADGHRLLIFAVDRLGAVRTERLDRADAEVFSGRRLDGPGSGAYWQRMAAPGARSVPLRPRFLRAHGEPLVLVFHPWRLHGPPRRLALAPAPAGGGEGGVARYTAAVTPPLAAGEVVSLSLWLPRVRGRDRPGWVEIDSRRAALLVTRRSGRRIHHQSDRVTVFHAGDTLELRFEYPPARGAVVTLFRWRPPA